MDFDCLKNLEADASFSFESYEDSIEFEDLHHLFDDFPSLDDISLQSERSGGGELLPFGDIALEVADGVTVKSFEESMDFSIYDDDLHKINQYATESIPHLTRNSSSSSSSSSTTTATVVHDVVPLTAIPSSNGFSCQIHNFVGLLYHQGGNMHNKPPARKRNQRKPNVVRGQWTLEEDRTLARLADRYGLGKWSRIAQFLNGRIGKQCRERWHNHLRPNIKLTRISKSSS